MGPPCGPADGLQILNGRLFCNINNNYAQRFRNGGSQYINDGDERWAGWFGDGEHGPMNSGCYPGNELQKCMNGQKRFPNRTPEPGPSPSPTPSPTPAPVPSPTPTPTPTPSPSPSPSPDSCTDAVQSVCGQYIGSWDDCFQCCLDNEWTVHPVCPGKSDLHRACQAVREVVV